MALLFFCCHLATWEESREQGRWQIIKKTESCWRRDRRGNVALSQKSRGQSSFVIMKWKKKAVAGFLLGKLPFARAFCNGIIRGRVFPNPTDTRTLKPHLENVMNRLDCKFETIIADAGYGSEENYDYLEEKEITGVIKYSTYEKETKQSFKKKTFNFENWNYDSQQKKYTCLAGNPVPYKKTVTKKKCFRLSSNL